MIKRFVLGGALLAGMGAFLLAAIPAKSPAQPVLVELFTSQGCSSCPPADALAAKLSSEPNLVVVTRPVTYWDRLGWKDTLAREENTALQNAYARRGLAGNNGVYTPQMVVDGARGSVGSNAAQIRQFIQQSANAPAAIAYSRRDEGYSIGVAGSGQAELVLLALSAHETVKIGSGENGGRQIAYTNVVRAERKLADWRGGKLTVALAPAQVSIAGANRYALVLRQANGGKVFAARMLPG
jgi:hypothetical protein